MATQPAQVSVTAPVQPALDWTKRLLFQPFDLGKWFTIGFCAWLAYLGQGGARGGSALRSGRVPGIPSSLPSASRPENLPNLDRARDWAMANLHWLVPVAIVLFCLLVAVGLLILWLSSRGEFMFLHCVARDRAEVAVPWRRYAREAKSLFLFRIVLGLIGAVLLLPLAAVIAFFVFRIVFGGGGAAAAAGIPSLVLAGLALFLIGIAFAIVSKLTRDFAVPIMYLRGITCREAWREILALFSGRMGLPILYLLFQIVLAIAIGFLVVVAVIATCCIAGCLLLIPYIGTVVLLPVLVFSRSYSLFYLRQLGAQYDVFAQAPLPAAPQIPPPLPATSI
jgi:hypothetical protein